MDAYIKYFEAQLDQLRIAVESGSHFAIDEILGEEKFRATLKWKDSHSGEVRAKLVNLAVCNNDAATVRLLLAHGVTVNVDEHRSKVVPPLWCAVIRRRDEIAEILIGAGAEVNRRAGEFYQLDRGDSLLHAATRYGNSRLATLLINSGAKVNALNGKGETALHLAVKARLGGESMVRCLLEHGARIDIGFEPVLQLTVKQGNIDFTALIIELRENALEYKGWLDRNLLHYAVMPGSENIEMAKMLIGKGVPVNDPDILGTHPLHLAIETDNAKMVQVLINHGASLNIRNQFNKTPLMMATSTRNVTIINQLLEKGANVNLSTKKQGKTALHQACIKGFDEIVYALLKFRANPNAATRYDLTPLEIACHKGLPEMVRTLLKFGAKIQMNQTYTPRRYKSNIVQILIKHAVLRWAKDGLMCKWFHRAHKKDLYYLKCRREMLWMIRSEFYNKLTFYRILTAREHELMAMMRNERLREAFEAGYTGTLFPCYARDISERFEKVKSMLEARNSVEEILNSIFLTHLPCDVVNKILDYVSYDSMKILLDSHREPAVKLKNIF